MENEVAQLLAINLPNHHKHRVIISEDCCVFTVSQHSDLSVVASDDAMQLVSSLFWDFPHRISNTHRGTGLVHQAKTVFKASAGEKCDVNQNILKAETMTRSWIAVLDDVPS